MGRGKREERLPLPIVPCALSIFFIIVIFLYGYPAGASAEERATDVDCLSGTQGSILLSCDGGLTERGRGGGGKEP